MKALIGFIGSGKTIELIKMSSETQIPILVNSSFYERMYLDLAIPRLKDPTVVTIIENDEDISLKVDLVNYKGLVESITYKIINSHLAF